MHVTPKGLQCACEGARLDPMNDLELRRPAHSAIRYIPLPCTHSARRKSETQSALVGVSQRGLCLRELTQVALARQTRFECRRDSVMLERKRHVIGDLLGRCDFGIRER